MVAVLLGIAILIGGVLVISWQPGYMIPASEPEQESASNTQKQAKVVSKNNGLWAKLRSYRRQDTTDNNQANERTRLLQPRQS